MLARRERCKQKSANGNGFGLTLANAVKMWPTPRSCTAMSATFTANTVKAKFPNLETIVAQNTDSFVGKQLNPDWVELLMGWPCGWTSCTAMLSATEISNWLDAFTSGGGCAAWQTGVWERNVPRVSTCIADRVARLKAIGNGQVPACVVLAWNTLVNT